MIRAMVVDDEPLACEALSRHIEKDRDFEVVGRAASGDEALQAINKTPVDLLFLDIEMPGLNGIQLASRLAERENAPMIVFVTAYNQYAVEAFEHQAVDYVLKPYESKRLLKTLNRIKQVIRNKNMAQEKMSHLEKYLQLAEKGKAQKMVGFQPGLKTRIVFDANDVVYFGMKDSEIYAYFDNQELIIRSTFQELAAYLDRGQFVQTHRNFIVNINKMEKFEPMFNGNYEILMSGGKSLRIPLSRKFVDNFKACLNNW